ncbi:MAG TPA: DUF4321 domain-containing protein [Thermoanaerobacterales bacterium]|jgi:hypothetical protein|nr:DUF4321 domain-containing protein [Thermoanaerobacterales bacterium]
MKRNYRSPVILVIILIVGLVIGGVLGQVLGSFAPIINQGRSIGLSTTKLDLGIINITFGFNVSLNLAAVLGLIIAILLYQRM